MRESTGLIKSVYGIHKECGFLRRPFAETYPRCADMDVHLCHARYALVADPCGFHVYVVVWVGDNIARRVDWLNDSTLQFSDLDKLDRNSSVVYLGVGEYCEACISQHLE